MTAVEVRGTRSLALGSVCATLVLVLAGCSSDSALVAKASADTATHPVVAGPQATTILDQLDAALSQAGGDPGRAGPRAAGPYLDLLVARQKQALARRLTLTAPTAPARTRLVVPSLDTWPRFFLAVGDQRGQTTPVLRVLVSPDARTPYALWGEPVMLPGATLPEVTAPAEGAPALPPDATGLLMNPGEALSRFGDVLSRGTASRYVTSFARNAFSDQVIGRQAADLTGLAKVATMTAAHTLDPKSVYAVRTADGGALVVGRLTQKITIVVRPGAGTVKVADPDVAALAGRSEFTRQVVRTAVEVVVLAVPPSGGGQAAVVAATKADLTVSGT